MKRKNPLSADSAPRAPKQVPAQNSNGSPATIDTDSSTMAIVGAAGGRLAGEGRGGAAGEGIGSGLSGSVV